MANWLAAPLAALLLAGCKCDEPRAQPADAAPSDTAPPREGGSAPDANPPAAPALPLSALTAGAGAALYTTYAAPLPRSSYMVDEAYQLIYDEEGSPLSFATDTAGDLGFLFKSRGKLMHRIADYARAPVVTRSYADSGELRYEPLEDLEVTQAFAVYSSQVLVTELLLHNTGTSTQQVEVFAFLFRSGRISDTMVPTSKDRVLFSHREPPDRWSETPLAGYEPEFQNLLLVDPPADSWGSYEVAVPTLVVDLADAPLNQTVAAQARTILLARSFTLAAGAAARWRIVRAVGQTSKGASALVRASAAALSASFAEIFAASEAQYARIPRLERASAEEELIYYQAFSLVRQMMLPKEAGAGFNYYVFSREPTWGWGHDGQVFHESLVMLAYAHMDPQSAMGSQRVFIARQQPDGYIHYRIGPYVARDFPVNGEKTSSAPFFAWINWEVYQVAQDRSFLEEAYGASARYVRYMIGSRDKDGDGLFEWGGHAVLECVRDGYNVIWKLLGYQPDAPRRVEALDLNCMLVNELNALASMAKALGRQKEARAWRAQAVVLGERINQAMWDEETGFYYHVDRDTGTFVNAQGVDLRRMEIIGFLPLWAGIAPPERAALLLAHLKDERKFWRRFGVPTLAADDSFYAGEVADCCRWNGPIWFPWQYLLLRGLLRYDEAEIARELVKRNIAAAALQLRRRHTFFESYSADSETVKTLAPYVWDGILARMLLDVQQR